MEHERVLDAEGHFRVEDEAVDLAIYRWEDWGTFILFWMMAVVIFYQFFTRYALNDSAAWTEEIARYLLIGATFVGATVNVRKNNHIQVDVLYRLVPRWAARTLSTSVDVVRIAFLGYCVWLAVQLILRVGGHPMVIVDWPIGILYGVVGAGFALMSWRAVEVAIANWKRGASVLERPELADEAR